MTAHRSAYEIGTERTIRTRIRARGYPTAQAVYGLAWANAQGFTSADEGLSLAMSRIVYDDEALANGARFAV